MTNQEAERILNPATSREALLPYALDCQHRMALLDEACRVACAALRGPQWISVKERLPENEDFVFVAVTGKYRNIRFDHAVEIGAYYSEVDGNWSRGRCGRIPASHTGCRCRTRRRRGRYEIL